jgi:7-cyano-7-deazaguanine synthase
MRGQNSRTALVLFSGGQDSTTCLYWAKREFPTVEAIAFDYGQRHRVELEQAELIAKQATVPLQICNVRGLLSGSALTDPDQDPAAPHVLNPDLPAAFLPGRNALFLTIAAAEACRRGIHDLVGGMCQTDYSGYPDCRRTFVDSMEKSLSLAMDFPFQIHTPLMNLSKAEIWRLAKELGVLEIVRELTHTDYHGDRSTYNEWGYGKLDNPASILRAQGYEEAKRQGWV